MTANFNYNGIEYMRTEKGYFYKVEDGKKIRIKQDEYEQAFDAKVDDDAEQAFEEEATREIEEREAKQAEADKEAEDAFNGTKKQTRKRKSKDIAFEMDTLEGHTTLTKKQVEFIQMMPKDDFYENGLESTLWIDIFADTIADTFNRMAVGAMISTLREKNLIYVASDRVNGKKCKSFGFTTVGQAVAKNLGLK